MGCYQADVAGYLLRVATRQLRASSNAVLTFLIALRVRAASAVMLNRFALAADRVGFLWSKFHQE